MSCRTGRTAEFGHLVCCCLALFGNKTPTKTPTGSASVSPEGHGFVRRHQMYLNDIAKLMSGRPRQTFKWKTPDLA
ncbi:hypothetical protein DF143_19770 [Burkholderia cenocepacia]|nr:hypothetical protein DF143_19770 [Burkholderia cenocepacia]RQV41672.1 hypothetical protein DF033_20865 [Burkholderia cenocepacia]